MRPSASRPSTPATRPVVVTHQVGDGEPVADVGAGVGGGVDEDRVEHGAARRVEGVDARRSA